MMPITNPFVYGEVVPDASFVDREVELDRLAGDLVAGQKVFLISPRRYGKSSLIRQALRSAERGGALAVDVTVSSYSSYVAFLEGYARALLSVETRLDSARAWFRDMLGPARPEIRVERNPAGASRLALSFPAARTDRDVVAAGRAGVRAAGPHRRRAAPAPRGRARRVPGHRVVRRGRREGIAHAPGRARAARRGAAPAPGRVRVLRVRTDAHGADARAEPPVLQGRPGDAPPEDSAGPVRRVRRCAVPRDAHAARRGARRRDRRSRGQPALRRAAPRARGLGRRARRGPEDGRTRGSARHAEAAARGARRHLRGHVAAPDPRPAGGAPRGGHRGRPRAALGGRPHPPSPERHVHGADVADRARPRRRAGA